MNVLLAEDNRALAKALRKALDVIGYEVDLVFDGYQAMDKLHCGGYDCLIIENDLPRMAGANVVREAKSKSLLHSAIGILSTSYYDGAMSPYDVVLPKPFAFESLKSAIAQLGEAQGKETYGFITLDFDRRELFYKGKTVSLTLPEMETAKRVATADAPVAANCIDGLPLVHLEGSAFRVISLINDKLKNAKFGLQLVSTKDKGYRVCYD